MSQQVPLLDKAQENITAAELLLREGHTEIAASRAYYAMFYIAEALLFSLGLAFSSHSAVIAAYGKEFAKTNLLPPEYHRYLKEAFETRQVGDYEVGQMISHERTMELLFQARSFLNAAREYLAND